MWFVNRSDMHQHARRVQLLNQPLLASVRLKQPRFELLVVADERRALDVGRVQPRGLALGTRLGGALALLGGGRVLSKPPHEGRLLARLRTQRRIVLRQRLVCRQSVGEPALQVGAAPLKVAKGRRAEWLGEHADGLLIRLGEKGIRFRAWQLWLGGQREGAGDHVATNKMAFKIDE